MGDEQAAGQGVWEKTPGLETTMACTCCSPWAGGGGGGPRAGSSAGGGGGRGGSIDDTSNERSSIMNMHCRRSRAPKIAGQFELSDRKVGLEFFQLPFPDVGAWGPGRHHVGSYKSACTQQQVSPRDRCVASPASLWCYTSTAGDLSTHMPKIVVTPVSTSTAAVSLTGNPAAAGVRVLTAIAHAGTPSTPILELCLTSHHSLEAACGYQMRSAGLS